MESDVAVDGAAGSVSDADVSPTSESSSSDGPATGDELDGDEGGSAAADPDGLVAIASDAFGAIGRHFPWKPLTSSRRRRRDRSSSAVSVFSDTSSVRMVTRTERRLKPETVGSMLCKLAVALAFFVFCLVSTSLTMVVVHERLPDPTAYPPLPDIVLDNVPRSAWAVLRGCCACLTANVTRHIRDAQFPRPFM